MPPRSARGRRNVAPRFHAGDIIGGNQIATDIPQDFHFLVEPLHHQDIGDPSAQHQHTDVPLVQHQDIIPVNATPSLGLNNFDVQLSQHSIPQTLLFDTSSFSGFTQHRSMHTQYDVAYSAPHASTSQTRVEDLSTQVTPGYGVAFIPVHAGEGTSTTSQQNNVISGITTVLKWHKRTTTMLSPPPACPLPPPPPTPLPPPPPAPLPPPPPSGLSLTKQQHFTLLFCMKKNLYRIIFTNDAMPRPKEACDSVIRAAINAASNTVLGTHPPPIKLRTTGVNHMWGTGSAFRKYAENTIDIFFGLQQPLRGATDAGEASYRQKSASALLAMEGYTFLHTIADGTILYFEHTCIRSAISQVVWKNLKCSDVVQPENMAPLVALVATSFIFALEARATGVTSTTRNSSDRFPEIYRQVSDFISHIVHADVVVRDKFIEFCTLVVTRSNAVLGPGVANTPEDNDF